MTDVKRVLDAMPYNKAPGLDGFSNHFFKASWDIVATDIYKAIMDFFTTSKILKEVNVTSITLVPKVKVHASIGDYRPFACCSVIYKCISKLLCEKLNSMLPGIISCNQGAFVSRRSILHNVLVC